MQKTAAHGRLDDHFGIVMLFDVSEKEGDALVVVAAAAAALAS